MIYLHGVDASGNNGVVDWELFKKYNPDSFAMLRMGYGSDLKSQDDKQFERNVRECERLGIKWGGYLYSYALNLDEAKSEVRHTLRLLKGKTPDFPIAFDMEDADGYKIRNGMPTKQMLNDICYTFLDEVESHGYYVSLYANDNWLEHILTSPKLDRFDKWVAQWGDKTTYQKPHQMWQYSNHGNVEGFSGRVDLNIAYTDFNFDHHKSITKVYKIESGDNLSKIANKFDTDINTLLKLNPTIRNKNVIYAGKEMLVPNK